MLGIPFAEMNEFAKLIPEKPGTTLKEAMEKARSADPKRIRDALASIEIVSGPAGFMQPGKIKFDQTGWNSYVHPTMIQWQRGEPRTVYPEEDATNDVIWPIKR